MTILIQPDGTLQLPASVLEQLGTNEVEVRLEGKVVNLEAAPHKRIHELETEEERRAAFAVFLSRVAQPTGVSLPEDWATIRDSIYD